MSNYEKLKEKIKELNLQEDIIVLHVHDSPYYQEIALRSSGILKEGDEYFIGIEKTLSPEQLKLLEREKLTLDEDAEKAYVELQSVVEERLYEPCPKWNNGYEGEDENGEPVLDDNGETMRNMFG